MERNENAGGRPRPAALVASLIARRETLRAEALARLVRRFGPVGLLSEVLPFDFTDYYRAEMGSPLTRRLVMFDRPVNECELARLKKICMSIESDMSTKGRRGVNIDPGLLNQGALLLATCKQRFHRVCLEPGLYADLMLSFHSGCFHSFPWTYQDYAGKRIQTILEAMRRRHLWHLKKQPFEGD